MFACMLSHELFRTLWTVAHQAPLSTGFSRQEYWSRLQFPPPGDLPDWGTEHVSPASSASQDRFFTIVATWEALRSDNFPVQSLDPKFNMGTLKTFFDVLTIIFYRVWLNKPWRWDSISRFCSIWLTYIPYYVC